MESLIQLGSTIVVALATVFLVWLTSKYVRLTKSMADEMKASRGPSVYVDIEAPGQMFNLTVGNSGRSPAVNIRFTVEKDIKGLSYGKDEKGIESIPIIKKGISYLPPGRTLKWRAGVFRPTKDESQSNALQMEIFFENEQGKEFKRNFIIDMSLYDAVLFESYRDPSKDVAQAIERVESRIGSRSRSNTFTEMIGKKSCPMCGERIQYEAKKCPFCHEIITESEEHNLANSADAKKPRG